LRLLTLLALRESPVTARMGAVYGVVLLLCLMRCLLAGVCLANFYDI